MECIFTARQLSGAYDSFWLLRYKQVTAVSSCSTSLFKLRLVVPGAPTVRRVRDLDADSAYCPPTKDLKVFRRPAEPGGPCG